MPEPQFQHAEQELIDAFARVVKKDRSELELGDCPEEGVLRQIAAVSARKTGQLSDAVLAHIGSCDSCVAKLGAIRTQTSEDRVSLPLVRWPRYATLSAVAAVLLLAFISLWTWQGIWHGQPQHTAKVIDLRNASIVRGAEAPPPVELSAAVVDLSIYLPAPSDAGTYQIALVQTAGEKIIVSASGAAKRQGGDMMLGASMDLSKVKPGSYFLGIRPPGSAWSYYPAILR